MNLVFCSSAVIRNKKNQILIMSRKNKKTFRNCWEFPGGKVGNGELPEQTAIRELQEELNIDAEIGELFSSYTYNYPHLSYELFFFKVNSFFGEPVKSVHDKLKWEKLKNFYKYEFLPGDGPLID